MRTRFLGLMLAVLLGPPARAADHVSIALPGVPPVVAGTVFYVARDQGFFSKHGIDADLRPFDSGTAAAQAVASDDFDLSLSPTPGVIRMVSNAHVQLVAIWGVPVPDWQLAAVDPAHATCQDLRGAPIGIDAIGGARAVALAAFLRACGLGPDSVQQVPLSSNSAAAMAAGQLKFGVLHLDDVDTLEALVKHPVGIVNSFDKAEPLSHYLVLVAHATKLAARHDVFVRVLAALIESARWMQLPDNLDRAATIATVTGHPDAVMKKALPRFFAIHYWPTDNDGLGLDNLRHAIATEVSVGGIKRTPVSAENLIATNDGKSLWAEANALVTSDR